MSATQLTLAPDALTAKSPAVSVDGPRIVLRGPLARRLASESMLGDFLRRCRELDYLESVRFDLGAARIELTYVTHAASAALLRGWARVMRRSPDDTPLAGEADPRVLARRVWEAPLTLWRSGRILSTWQVRHRGGDRIRLSHPILADHVIAKVVAAQLRHSPVVLSIVRCCPNTASIDLCCDTNKPNCLAHLIMAAEAIEAVISERPFVRPAAVAGNPLLLNTNLILAAGAIAFPVLLPASAVVLIAASWPVIRQALSSLRVQRVEMTTVLACLSVLALVNGDHLPAALMLWLFRFWDKLTAARLRQVERGLFERLATRSAPGLVNVRGAAITAAEVFAEPPGADAAQSFANASAPLMLCLGAAALFPSGPAVAQAVLRPDFFCSVLVHSRLVAADLVLRLTDLGCVVRDVGALQQIRDADALMLDDSVAWQRDGLAPGAFGRALAELGLRELVYFRVDQDTDSDDTAAALGATRTITRSTAQTRVSYLAQRRFLGHRVVYAGAIGILAGCAEADPVIAVGPTFLADERDAPIGLLQPSLATLLTVMQLVRTTERGEHIVKIATTALNAAMVGAAAYLGLSTTGVVAVGTSATACVWAAHRLRPQRRPSVALLPAP